MLDADSLIDRDSVTELADDLNRAMDLDASARAAYRAIWGVDWSPLPTCGGDAYFTGRAGNSRSASTTANTVR